MVTFYRNNKKKIRFYRKQLYFITITEKVKKVKLYVCGSVTFIFANFNFFFFLI